MPFLYYLYVFITHKDTLHSKDTYIPKLLGLHKVVKDTNLKYSDTDTSL